MLLLLLLLTTIPYFPLSKSNFSSRANITDPTSVFFCTLSYQSTHVQTADVTIVKHVNPYMMFLNPLGK